ncbi:hypothetical protein [Jiangella alkaliphila]|uniref:Septum formation n=1 Tax=Jiangella alkaliphila TaxID=419479 RepID=A0A1H2KYZ3_9ACTN|nr:hypothetical protein [Jiangella alkaliphila]SDU73762.1 hypothetical protein SAMN04488563_4603 [Jiangella alkaliphila]
MPVDGEDEAVAAAEPGRVGWVPERPAGPDRLPVWSAPPQPPRPPRNGFAVAALIVGPVGLVAVIGVLYVLVYRDDGDDDGAPYWLEDTWAALRDGDCVDGLSTIEGETQQELDFPVVACSGPHEGEVYATFELAEGDYPGLTVVEERADQRCAQLLDGSPPETVSGPEYGYLYLYPHGDWWPEIRTVVCIAFDMDDVMPPGLTPAPRA